MNCFQSVLDEMMVEQTDLVRLRMVRMSNVPDTLYMVSNAVPQCCHMISHQQISSNQSSPPSVVANEIPGTQGHEDQEEGTIRACLAAACPRPHSQQAFFLVV